MAGWLDKVIKLLMNNHEIRLICSIPISECSNKYYEFISCLCMVEQSNELLIENHETCPNWVMLHSQKWMQQHLIYIFMIVIVIMIMDMVIKEISKPHFFHQKWHNNVKKGKGRCENIDKKMKVYIIIMVVKAIWVVLIVYQSILQMMRRT